MGILDRLQWFFTVLSVTMLASIIGAEFLGDWALVPAAVALAVFMVVMVANLSPRFVRFFWGEQL